MRRWLARVGLAFSLAAYAVLAFHVHHADADHSDPTHHCCPCHSYSAAPNLSISVQKPASACSEFQPPRPSAPLAQLPRRDGAPRAPPAA